MLTALLLALAPQDAPDAGGAPLHTTYLWHLHQPVYWPDQRRDGVEDEVEVAWESLQQKYGGAQHPEDNLAEIFGKDDRVAAYQWRVRDSLSTILWSPDAGAQIQYSGALTENVESLGAAFQLGYSPSWNAPLNEAQAWQTSGGTPRADIVNFAHQHALLPLCSERLVWLHVRVHQERMSQVWGIAPGQAKGFFPPETAFSERLIPVLAELGIEWSFVSNEHLSRACPDFPVVLGSGGVMCDPPNRADQVNAAQGAYWSKFIDRGCSPTNAAPFAYTPHRAQYVDPESGQISSIVVVPTAQAVSWDDGYSQIGADALSGIAPYNDPSRPMLVVLAHDGDNAWGGGFSYYMQAVQNFVGSASAAGHRPSTVARYLADFPVPANDLVHVEDGAWVNADSDFGSPLFTNWLYPLLDAQGQLDPVNGWHNKAREYAIFTAAENRIRTAEDLAGGPSATRVEHVLDPQPTTTPVERAWHYLMAGMDSGNVYYGSPGDMEVKGTVAANEAAQHVDPLLANLAPGADATEPTVFVPQRHPYNPGGVNFGAPYGYQSFTNDGSFTVWTFAHDVSGLASATLYTRADADGHNPLDTHENELYAGGPGVGAWQAQAMQVRAFPANNVYGWGGLESYAYEMPLHIAEHLSATVAPQLETLLDYYVEVVDGAGNVARSPIQHVWVGEGGGSPPGGAGVVELAPDPPLAGQTLTITYDATGRPLEGAGQVYAHVGFDGWAAGSVQHLPMSSAGAELWELAHPVPSNALVLDLAFNDDADWGGTWDNNGGGDWHFEVEPAPAPTGGGFAQPHALPALLVEPALLRLEAVSGQPFPQPELALTNAADSALAWTLRAPGSARWLQPSLTQGATPTALTLDLDATLPPGTYSTLLRFSSPDADGVSVPLELRVHPPAPAGPSQTGVDPAPPVAGQSVRVWYVADAGPLAGQTGLLLHWGVDGWQQGSVQDVALLPAASGSWYADLDLPAAASELNFVAHNGQGLWDNNGGADWVFPIAPAGWPPGVPLSTGVDPDPPVAGQSVRVWYLAGEGPLANQSALWVHQGLNGWSASSIVDLPLIPLGSDVWYVDLNLPLEALELDFVFHDGAGLWDNNGGSDWVYAVLPEQP